MPGTDAESVVELLVGYNEHLLRPSAWQTPEETTFETDYSDLFGASSSKKPKAKALLMFEQTTTSGVETSCYFVLTLTVSMSLCACSAC